MAETQVRSRDRLLMFAATGLALLFGGGASYLAYYNYQISLNTARESKGELLAATARSAAAALDGDRFATLFAASSSAEFERQLRAAPQRGEWTQMREALEKQIKAHSDLKFDQNNLYVFAIDPENSQNLRWALMAHSESFVGEPYAATPEMLAVLRDGRPSAFTPIYTSLASGGQWMSGYAGLRDSRGRLVGLVEAALNIQAVQVAARDEAERTLNVALGFVALSMLASFALFHFLLRVRQSNDQLQRVVREMKINNLNLHYVNLDLKSQRERLARPLTARGLLSGFVGEKMKYSVPAELMIIEDLVRRVCSNLRARLSEEDVLEIQDSLRKLLRGFLVAPDGIGATPQMEISAAINAAQFGFRLRLDRSSENAISEACRHADVKSIFSSVQIDDSGRRLTLLIDLTAIKNESAAKAG